MATIDLGVIKPVFKGAYNNSTAYILDNIVTSGGSSYICILASTGNAVSNGTYWTQMSAVGANGTNGTNGTDVGTTITTQGDVLYRDGSGLQRLAKGTAGQALTMNSGATAPEWGTAGGLLEYSRGYTTTTTTINSTTAWDVGIRAKLNPTSASQLIRLNWQWSWSDSTDSTAQDHRLEYRLNSGSWVSLTHWAVHINHWAGATGMYSTSNLSWIGLASAVSAVSAVLEFRVLVRLQSSNTWILNEGNGGNAHGQGQNTFLEAHLYDSAVVTGGTNV